MAEVIERTTKLRDAALVLSDDVTDATKRLNKYLRSGQYAKVEMQAEALQRLARDVKWLMKRLPKD